MTDPLNIDWTVFDQYPEQTCECRCGTVWRTHAKLVSGERGLHLITRKPCPGCGKPDAVRKASSDPEQVIV